MMEVAPFLKSDEVNKLFNGGNFDPKRNLNYDEFCNYVSRLLVCFWKPYVALSNPQLNYLLFPKDFILP
jgi:hypothetical protein